MHNSKFFHLILLNHVYEDRRQNSERANEMKFCERYKSCLKQYLLIKNVLCFCLFVKAWTPIGLFYKMLHCLKAFICRLNEFLSVLCPVSMASTGMLYLTIAHRIRKINYKCNFFELDAKGDKSDWSGLRGKNQPVELYKLRSNWKFKKKHVALCNNIICNKSILHRYVTNRFGCFVFWIVQIVYRNYNGSLPEASLDCWRWLLTG